MTEQDFKERAERIVTIFVNKKEERYKPMIEEVAKELHRVAEEVIWKIQDGIITLWEEE